MRRHKVLIVTLAAGIAFLMAVGVTFGSDALIKLPPPDMEGGMPLMKALKERKTSREFSDKKLTDKQLSNLLWAAFGINRQDSGKRTAPSAMNGQEIAVYVALPEGLYLYEAKEHDLKLIVEKDIRAATGMQKQAGESPVSLIYVADFGQMKMGAKEDKIMYSAADTGFISQNVYLYCASEGLATYVRGAIDRTALAKEMKLSKGQNIILAQSVGYPK